MGEELWLDPPKPAEPVSCPLCLMAHPFILAACPSNDKCVNPRQGRTQLRLVEAAVVGDPAADARVVHLRQILQGFVAAMMQRPAPDGPTNGRQRFRAGCRHEAVGSFSVPNGFPGPKLKAKKIKMDVGKVAAPVCILAVDDLRLLVMQLQLAGRKTICKRAPQCLRRFGAFAVTNRIIRIALEWNVRVISRHPHVERVVQEQVRQQRADDTSLRRPRRARHDAFIFQLHRRLQPAFDVEQHPCAIRMLADSRLARRSDAPCGIRPRAS